MPINDLNAVLTLHPLPWKIVENWDFGDAAPLSILDANGVALLAVAGHGDWLEPTHRNDHLVAGTLIQLAGAAPGIIEVLDRLLRWAEQMGGWEAPCWVAARDLRERLATPRQDAPSTHTA
jgi:hypothetical protein